MTIHVDRSGEGRDVVLLHGLPQEPADLTPLARALADTHRTWLVHLPGYGESPPWPREDYVVAEVGAAIAQTLRELGVRDPAIVGFSGGSYRAFQLALDHPELNVRAIAALAPLAGQDDGGEGLRGFADALERGVDLTDACVDRFFSEGYRERHLEEATRSVRSMLAATEHASLNRELRGFASQPDLRPRLGALDVDVLLRVGELDVATTAEGARDLTARLPRGALTVVRGAGHLLLMVDAEATEAAVRRFLARVG